MKFRGVGNYGTFLWGPFKENNSLEGGYVCGWLSKLWSLFGYPKCRIIIGIQKGTIILTTTHVGDPKP